MRIIYNGCEISLNQNTKEYETINLLGKYYNIALKKNPLNHLIYFPSSDVWLAHTHTYI